ncbi:MAG: hypothetical protein ACN6Q5_10675, partial [Pseudomonas sp.]|uniref:hypothetical protein n=1 Tax=Pseudomonas sp. TaxID=306 RepID=UPI003D0D37A8
TPLKIPASITLADGTLPKLFSHAGTFRSRVLLFNSAFQKATQTKTPGQGAGRFFLGNLTYRQLCPEH